MVTSTTHNNSPGETKMTQIATYRVKMNRHTLLSILQANLTD